MWVAAVSSAVMWVTAVQCARAIVNVCTVQIELWTSISICSIQRCCLLGKLVLGGEDCSFSVLLWAMQSGESLLSAVHLHCVGVVIPWVAMHLPLWVLPLAAEQQRCLCQNVMALTLQCRAHEHVTLHM